MTDEPTLENVVTEATESLMERLPGSFVQVTVIQPDGAWYTYWKGLSFKPPETMPREEQ